VSLWELLNAYRTLANGGAFSPLKLTRGESAARREVIDPASAFIVSDILSDREARSLTFGLENALATRYWSAAKTGTSKDIRDNWCIGFSRRYTVGVWVGNFDGSPMTDVSGVTGAAPLWLEVMNYLHAGEMPMTPSPPAGVVRRPAAGEARIELFLAGTETDMLGPKSQLARAPKIAYPREGEIISLDPDIPTDVQRVRLEADPPLPRLRWRIERRGDSQREIASWWAPRAGRFELTLADASGKTLDRVAFEVRGAPGAQR
jgi:penicillin-binding protein 1C